MPLNLVSVRFVSLQCILAGQCFLANRTVDLTLLLMRPSHMSEHRVFGFECFAANIAFGSWLLDVTVILQMIGQTAIRLVHFATHVAYNAKRSFMDGAHMFAILIFLGETARQKKEEIAVAHPTTDI